MPVFFITLVSLQFGAEHSIVCVYHILSEQHAIDFVDGIPGPLYAAGER